MGLIGKPVPVEADDRGYPRRFFWHRWYRVVEILDEWRETGAWWDGEEERVVVRVLTAEGALFELERSLGRPAVGAGEPQPGRWPAGSPAGSPAGPPAGSPAWRLYKVYD